MLAPGRQARRPSGGVDALRSASPARRRSAIASARERGPSSPGGGGGGHLLVSLGRLQNSGASPMTHSTCLCRGSGALAIHQRLRPGRCSHSGPQLCDLGLPLERRSPSSIFSTCPSRARCHSRRMSSSITCSSKADMHAAVFRAQVLLCTVSPPFLGTRLQSRGDVLSVSCVRACVSGNSCAATPADQKISLHKA